MDSPKEILIEICRKCTLNCQFCSSNSDSSKSQFIPMIQLENIAKDIIELGINEIHISGGEPFLHRDLLNFIKLIRNQGKVIIYTSGNMLHNQERIAISVDKFTEIKADGVSLVRFNLQSHLEGINNLLTSTNSYQNTIKSIKNAQIVNLTTEIHLIPNQKNIVELEATIDFLKALHVNKVKFLRYLASGRGGANIHELDIRTNSNVIPLFKHLKEKFGDFLEIGAAYNDNICSHSCNFGINKYIITPDLFVYPCVSVKNLSLFNFNLKDNKLKDIICSMKYQDSVKTFLQKYKKPNCCPSQEYFLYEREKGAAEEK